MKKQKVFTGNYDGLRSGLVIAPSQKRAAEIAGCSLYSFRDFWGETTNTDVSGLESEVLYTRKMEYFGKGNWEKGRCELNPTRGQGNE